MPQPEFVSPVEEQPAVVVPDAQQKELIVESALTLFSYYLIPEQKPVEQLPVATQPAELQPIEDIPQMNLDNSMTANTAEELSGSDKQQVPVPIQVEQPANHIAVLEAEIEEESGIVVPSWWWPDKRKEKLEQKGINLFPLQGYRENTVAAIRRIITTIRDWTKIFWSNFTELWISKQNR